MASSWADVLTARVVDHVGKGIRTAPRDVLVSESADNKNMGKAFGIHKALDMAGSAVGIIISFFLISNIGNSDFDYKNIFLLSMIPAIIGLVTLLFIKEKKQNYVSQIREPFWTRFKDINGDLKLYLGVTFVFTLGNSSNVFLPLRAKCFGFNDMTVVLLYLIFNLVAAIFSVPFGKLSDKIGRKKVLVAGYLTFSVVYFGFALVSNNIGLIATFVLYGLYTALTAGAERAFIAEISPKQLKRTMLGLHSTIVGIALLPASVIAGFLWDMFGSFAPFTFGAILSLVAALMLIILMNKNHAIK